MDARKFFLVSLGVLALASAYHLGAGVADAGFTDSNLGIRSVSFRVVAGTSAVEALLLEDGTILAWDGAAFREVSQPTPLPVPPSAMLIFDVELSGGNPYVITNGFIVTTDGVAFHYPPGGGWLNRGTVPGVGPVAAGSTSFGRLKGGFRGKK